MKQLSKILLATSVISFAASLSGPGGEVWFGILKPVGALLFVVAFIVHVVSRLDPEQYAEDQRLRDELLHTPRPVEATRLQTLSNAAA